MLRNEPDKRSTVEVGRGVVTIKQPGRSNLIVANILGTRGECEGGPEVIWLDRLVHRRDTGEWWVLDHKSEWRPELKPGLQDKMNNYRAAVQAAYPQAVVRAAYLTAQGKLVNV